MAGAPPRRESLGAIGNIHSTKQRSCLETLLTMGFSRERAEKAIAATGDKGVNFASEWLLSHVNDPIIDVESQREYIFYLCPTGELLEQLLQYWQTSKSIGWNAAHVYHPHVTLCPFFKMPNNKVPAIEEVVSMMSRIVQQWNSFGYCVGLDLGTKNKSFIGYFVSRPIHELIEDLMIRVQQALNKHGVEIELQRKQLHMTLAFKYTLEHHDRLMELATLINVPQDVTWEVRLYSRDACLRSAQTRRIIKDYKPVQPDELELSVEDYIMVDPQEIEKSQDGWYKGTSHLTGAVGFFPGNFTEQCSEMDTWTLHRTVLFKCQTEQGSCSTDQPIPFRENGNTNEGSALSDSDYDNLWVNPTSELYATVNKKKVKKGDNTRPSLPPQPQKVFIMRHGQRCDFNFRNWYLRSFNENGTYTRIDLNCPSFVWPRQSFKDYSRDGPITEIGKAQAFITGEGLRDAGEDIPFIYASPSLRCVQTANEIIRGLQSQVSICLEPGLFEWCGWCREGMPTFLLEAEFLSAGFPINTSYVPFIRAHQLELHESVETYYNRSHQTTQHIIRRHSAQKGRILLVGHSGSMDACSRQLRGKPANKTDVQLRDVIRGCPYCFVSAVVEDPKTQTWDLCEPPTPALTHGGNKEYDWRSLMS